MIKVQRKTCGHLAFWSSVQFSSVAQLCPTLCDPMNRSTPGLPGHHQFPEFTQTHVHWVGDAIQPSHPLSTLLLLPPILPSIRDFTKRFHSLMLFFNVVIYRKNSVSKEYNLEHKNLSSIVSEVAQSCPTHCDSMDCSPPGFSIHGFFQARSLEWVAISFSRGIFPIQGLNPALSHCRQMLYPLSHQGSQRWPKILKTKWSYR